MLRTLCMSVALLSSTIALGQQKAPLAGPAEPQEQWTGSAKTQPLSAEMSFYGCPATRFRLMDTRCVSAFQADEGYRRSGVPLVAYYAGHWFPAESGDDIGLYYFAPQLSRFLHFGPAASVDFVFAGILLVGFAIGASGAMRLFRLRSIRIAATLVLLVNLVIDVLCGDVYIALSAIIVAVVPWALYFCRMPRCPRVVWPAAFLAGVAASIMNYIRVHSGTAALIFIAVIVLFSLPLSRPRRALLVSVMLAGVILPIIFFHAMVSRRDAVLQKLEPGYRSSFSFHPIWHSIYIGFGYLSNDYVPQYSDKVAADKVKSIDPTAEYASPEDERILRTEVMRLIKSHPKFILQNLEAKVGVLLVFLVVFANIGLLAAVRCPKPWPVELAFWSTLLFSALPGILTVPVTTYLLGFVSLAMLYGLVSVNYLLESSACTRDSVIVRETRAGVDARTTAGGAEVHSLSNAS